MFITVYTLFSVNLDNGHDIAMKVDTEVKNSDVVSGDMGVIMMVTLGGGQSCVSKSLSSFSK